MKSPTYNQEIELLYRLRCCNGYKINIANTESPYFKDPEILELIAMINDVDNMSDRLNKLISRLCEESKEE